MEHSKWQSLLPASPKSQGKQQGFYGIPCLITSKQQNKSLLKTSVILLSYTTLFISTQQICQASPGSVLDPYANIQAPTKEEKQQQFLKQLQKEEKKHSKKAKKSHKSVKKSSINTESSTKNTESGAKDNKSNAKDNEPDKQNTKPKKKMVPIQARKPKLNILQQMMLRTEKRTQGMLNVQRYKIQKKYKHSQ